LGSGHRLDAPVPPRRRKIGSLLGPLACTRTFTPARAAVRMSGVV